MIEESEKGSSNELIRFVRRSQISLMSDRFVFVMSVDYLVLRLIVEDQIQDKRSRNEYVLVIQYLKVPIRHVVEYISISCNV